MASGAFKDGLDIREIVYQVREEDVVERFGRGETLRVGKVKLQVGVPLTSQREHFLAKIDSHAACWFHRGQEVAQTAAQLKDPPAGRNEEGVIPLEELVIPTPTFARPFCGALIVEELAVHHGAVTPLARRPPGAGREGAFGVAPAF